MNCQEYIRYSDILDGKYEINQLESINRIEKYLQTGTVQTNHKNDLIEDLIQAQSRCNENVNQLGYMIKSQSSKRYTQSEFSTPKLNMSQVSQFSQIQTPSKPYQSTPASPQLFNQLNNDNLLEQIEKLIKIRKLDQSILLRIIRKHMTNCPYFVQLVKQEFRNSINTIQ